jgi:calcineurin-like phosphoesterase family protein
MENIFFISDTHFGHANILKYDFRPFDSIEEHDEILIQNWNQTVKNNDHVYFLGDLSLKSSTFANKIISSLSGKIHFIEGNHDKSTRPHKNKFISWKSLDSISINNEYIVLCHYAMRTWNKLQYNAWHLYGHSHGSLDDNHGLSIDVGVDAIAMRLSNVPLGIQKTSVVTLKKNYRPMHFDEVSAIMHQRKKICVDHHI